MSDTTEDRYAPRTMNLRESDLRRLDDFIDVFEELHCVRLSRSEAVRQMILRSSRGLGQPAGRTHEWRPEEVTA